MERYASRDYSELGFRMCGDMADSTDKEAASPECRIELLAEPEPLSIDLARSALIIVDMQNDFLHPEGWFPKTGRKSDAAFVIVPVIQTLVRTARDARFPVIWVNWGVRPDAREIPAELRRKATANGARLAYGDRSPSGRGHILVRGDWGAEIIADLIPGPDDVIVYKHRYTGFHETELDAVLRNLGIETLFFTGINTDRCVYATLADATSLGYRCLLIEDACATISPPEVRDSILYLVRLLHGATTKSQDVLAALTAPNNQQSLRSC
jgi:nicotinamidase-related amidase